MTYQLLYSAGIIGGIFACSISTAYNIFKIKNKPFINPNHNFREYCDGIIVNLFPVIYGSIVLSYYCSYLLDDTPHNLGVTFLKLSFYALFVELFYYIYHRIVHLQYFYKNIHAKHHENINIYPLDSLYFDMLDIGMYIFCLHLPLVFVKMSLFEYCLGLYFYITMGFFSHSTFIYDHHTIHHKLFKCNFCLVFPLFDVVFDTHRISMKNEEEIEVY